MRKDVLLLISFLAFLLPAIARSEEVSETAKPAEISCGGEAATVQNQEQGAAEGASAEVGIEKSEGIVTKVLDAGTVKIDGRSMRLLGVSAPRRWWWGPSRDCYSLISSKYMEDAVLGRQVSYTRDPNFRNLKDGHHRIYLYVDGRQLNSELIQKGLVLADHTKEYIENERYANLEDGAKLHFIGLWHTCAVECEYKGTCRTKDW